jgi:hypothetical protein
LSADRLDSWHGSLNECIIPQWAYDGLSMKPESEPAGSPSPIINAELAALAEKCDGPNQFENFDKLFRAVIAVPKAAINKEEAK